MTEAPEAEPAETAQLRQELADAKAEAADLRERMEGVLTVLRWWSDGRRPPPPSRTDPMPALPMYSQAIN